MIASVKQKVDPEAFNNFPIIVIARDSLIMIKESLGRSYPKIQFDNRAYEPVITDHKQYFYPNYYCVTVIKFIEDPP